jgi:ubiquinone/menaquinone biosynthesis C-methylase UbiE
METAKTMWTGSAARVAANHFASARREHRDVDFLKLVLASLTGDENVLDVGAGSGFLSLAIAAKLNGGKVVAVDLSGDMLGKLHQRSREQGLEGVIDIRQTDAATTGLPDASVDLAVSVGLLHELQDPAAAFGEVHRVLRPGGRLVLKDFRAGLLWSPMMRLIHPRGACGPFSPSTLREVMEGAGFRQIRMWDEGSHHLVATASR